MSFKSNFAVKCIAVVLFAVFLTVTLLSSVCLVFGIATGTFTTETERHEYKQSLMRDMLWSNANIIRRELKDYAEFYEDEGEDYYYFTVSDNVLYEIKNADGKIIFSNMDETAGDIQISEEYVFSFLKDEYRNTEIPEEELFEESTTLEYEMDNGEPATAVEDTITFNDKYYDEKIYSITLCLKEELVAHDAFYYAGEMFDFITENETKLSVTAIISAVLSVVLFIFLMCASGHKDEVEGIHISRFDRFPVDILSAIYIGLTILLGYGIVWCYEEFNYYMMWYYYDATMNSAIPFLVGLCIIGVVLDFILFAILSMTTAVRLKTKTFIKSTLIFMVLNICWEILKICWKILKMILKTICKICKTTWKTICKICRNSFNFTGRVLRKIPLVWKTILIVIALGFLEMLLFVVSFDYDFILLWFIFNVVLGVCTILIAIILKQIKKGTEEIAKGNIYKKINTKYMFLDFKDHAENINNINDGIAKAVEERMKSERFKTELITNVSHDIKTPLTSIINYVDLLEKEEINSETAKEYIGVLSRQSARLKKLIEDLLEASKASTGNINVNLSKFELGILLTQALGEYEERFQKNNLQVVLNKTDEMLLVMADNRHMWRVFDNILNNIAKYAQPNTRIYIDANRKNQIAEISFRNISKDPLNISGDELMERFVRGDSSRNTEGSGLGLSIAKSLTEVQKGTLDIQIDGDLFKVRLAFPLSE